MARRVGMGRIHRHACLAPGPFAGERAIQGRERTQLAQRGGFLLHLEDMASREDEDPLIGVPTVRKPEREAQVRQLPDLRRVKVRNADPSDRCGIKRVALSDTGRRLGWRRFPKR